MIEIKYPRSFGAAQTVEFSSVWDDNLGLEDIFAAFNAGSGCESTLFCKLHVRSMSSGDFVKFKGQWYQCLPVGWREVTEERVKEIMAKKDYQPYSDGLFQG